MTTNPPPTKFSDYQLEEMGRRLADPAAHPTHPPGGGAILSVPIAGHVDHCFYQLYRFADAAERGGEFRAMQFGLNLGRVQEMLGSHGGPDMWWRPFEALVAAKNWAAVKGLVITRCDALGRPRPVLQ